MELRHLRYFVAAAEAENVSRAALKLHVSQPALSRQIRDLEDELRFPLFERSAKSVRLTDAGRTFLNEARAVLKRADEAIANGRAAASGARGELHVGYAPSPTVRVLPPTLRAFQSDMPRVRVRLHDLSTQEMLLQLRENKLHVALMVHPGKSDLRGLHFEEVMRDTMCLALPPSHNLARSPSIKVSAAAQLPLVGFSRTDYPEYHDYLSLLFHAGKKPVRLVEEHDSHSSLVTAVESGAGVAVVPESFSCTAGPRLKLIPLLPTPDPLIIGVVWLKNVLNPATDAFVRCARNAMNGP